MAQERFEIEMNAGTTYRMSFVPALQAPDGTTTDYDLTDATFRMYVKDERKLRFAVYSLPVEHDDALNADVVRLYLPPSETSKYLPHRRYFFVMDMIYPSGDVERVLDGPIRVRPFTSEEA